MGIFSFDYYNNSVKKIRCIYTYDDETSEKTYWEGYIITQNIDGVLDIEGYEIDKMDSLERNGNPHKRYILGKRSISDADKSLSFEIYPGNIAPIRYDMRYNPEDGCFYGTWVLFPSKNHPLSPAKVGHAIIRIEDVILDKNEISKIIEQVAKKARKEYSEEIEKYEYLAHNQLISSIDDNMAAVKKLSRLSSTIIK